MYIILRAIERYLDSSVRAAIAPLSGNPADLRRIARDAHKQELADRDSMIAFSSRCEQDGKFSDVVEDQDGNRVRNLISGAECKAGERVVLWDGLDDAGNIAKPGAYRWRMVWHPGITAEYRGAYGNGGEPGLDPFGTNHGSALRRLTRRPPI